HEAGLLLKVVDMPAPLKNLDTDHIINQYRAGVPEQAIGKALGISRSVVSRVLRQGGVERRTQSDAAHLRMAATTPEYRKALAAAAHDARRGQVDSWEVRVNRSASMRENRVGMFE